MLSKGMNSVSHNTEEKASVRGVNSLGPDGPFRLKKARISGAIQYIVVFKFRIHLSLL